MKFSCYLLSNGNDTDPHSLFYGDKSMWTQTKRRSSEGCMLYLRLRLLRVLCLTRDPRSNEEWDPLQLSVTDFMIFKFNEFWVACSIYNRETSLFLTPAFTIYSIVIIRHKAIWKCVYCLYFPIYFTFISLLLFMTCSMRSMAREIEY